VEKISDSRVCFTVSLEEVRRYGLCPLGQLKRNPGAKLLFQKKVEEVKNNASKGNS